MTEEIAPATSQEQEQPHELRTLANGAVYDMEEKRIVANPGGGTTAITQATASDMHAKRRAAKTIAVLQGIEDGSERPNWRGGVRDMSAALTRLALKGNEHSPKAFNAILRAAELVSEGHGNGSNGSGLTITMEFGPEIAEQLVAILDKRR